MDCNLLLFLPTLITKEYQQLYKSDRRTTLGVNLYIYRYLLLHRRSSLLHLPMEAAHLFLRAVGIFFNFILLFGTLLLLFIRCSLSFMVGIV